MDFVLQMMDFVFKMTIVLRFARGNYWSDCAETAPSWRAAGAPGEAAAATLWGLSERLVAASAAGPSAVILANKVDISIQIDELCIRMMNFVLKMMNFVLKMKSGAWRPVVDGEAFGPGHRCDVLLRFYCF